MSKLTNIAEQYIGYVKDHPPGELHWRDRCGCVLRVDGRWATKVLGEAYYVHTCTPIDAHHDAVRERYRLWAIEQRPLRLGDWVQVVGVDGWHDAQGVVVGFRECEAIADVAPPPGGWDAVRLHGVKDPHGKAWFRFMNLARIDAPPAAECAACGADATGSRYAIHRDGFSEGPEVPICTACGSRKEPSCEALWAAIAERSAVLLEQPFELGDRVEVTSPSSQYHGQRGVVRGHLTRGDKLVSVTVEFDDDAAHQLPVSHQGRLAFGVHELVRIDDEATSSRGGLPIAGRPGVYDYESPGVVTPAKPASPCAACGAPEAPHEVLNDIEGEDIIGAALCEECLKQTIWAVASAIRRRRAQASMSLAERDPHTAHRQKMATRCRELKSRREVAVRVAERAFVQVAEIDAELMRLEDDGDAGG